MSRAEVLERWRRWSDGPRQGVTATWLAHAKRDPTFSRVRACVEIILGGQVIRVSTVNVRTRSTHTGELIDFVQGLTDEPDVVSSSRLGANAASARSIRFSIPSDLVDGWAILQHGLTFTGFAEVSWIIENGDYDDRWVIMRGEATASGFGAPGEPLTVTVQDFRISFGTVPPPVEVTTSRWPDARDDAIGRRIPVVINGYPSVEGRVVEYHNIVPGHVYVALCLDPLGEFTLEDNGGVGPSDRVFVDDEDQAYPPERWYTEWTSQVRADDLGTPVFTVEWEDSLGERHLWSGREVVVANVQLKDGINELSVLDIAERLILTYGNQDRAFLNWWLWGDVKDRMLACFPKVLIDSSGEEVTTVIEWLEGALSSDFRMLHWAYDGAGYGPVLHDWRTTSSGQVLTVGEYPVIQRETIYLVSPRSERFTRFQVRYNFDRASSDYGTTLTKDSSESNSLRLIEEQEGEVREYSAVECSFVFDDQAALYIANWLTSHLSWPTLYVEVSVLPWVLIQVQLGQNIVWNDSTVGGGISNAIATVEMKGYSLSLGRAVLGLRIANPYAVRHGISA